MQPDGASLVLIGGLHRSGTSFLARTIESAKGATGLRNTGAPQDEGQFVQGVFDNTPSGRVGRFAYDPAARLTEADATPEAGPQLLKAWSQYWDNDASLFVEKSPPNMLRTRFYDTVFPKATQIMVVRNPLVVTMASQKWTYASLFAGLEHTLTAYTLMFQDLLTLQCPWIVIRYESFIDEPSSVIDPIAAMLGIDNSDIPPPEVRADVDKGYAKQFEGHQNPAQRRRRVFRKALQPLRGRGWELGDSYAELRLIAERYQHEMAALGYDMFQTLPEAPATLDRDGVERLLGSDGFGRRPV